MESIKVDIRKLKTPEVYAQEYGLSKPTVYKYIREGLLKKIVISGKVFIRIP
jgi:predicted DNA-binding transcriptional regulator AlpA